MRWPVMLLCAVGLVSAAPAQPAPWSAQPWLDDLAQMHAALRTRYANVDWLEHDRDVSLARLFDRAAIRLKSVASDGQARAVFDRLIQRIGDGHVSIDWPSPRSSDAGATGDALAPDICSAMGFDASRSAAGIGPRLPGYRRVGGDGPFPAGIIPAGKRTVGVLRIGGFEPQGYPPVCHAALQALHIAADKPCSDACDDAVMAWSYNWITAEFERQIRALRKTGATVLLVDITGNGGGTEWTEAAARIVSPVALTSERRGFVRGSHWSGQWQDLAAKLRAAAATSGAGDRARLLDWAAAADRAKSDADSPCAAAGACPLVASAGYATGLVGSARAGAFAGKPWADLVFSTARFPYHDSVWTGPLAVLVDDETWSAAEEFAAVLQDNRAAIIIGTRTGGAGCGHTNGGTPTVLANSGATLEVPDCVRFRADGSNEVAGVIPDILTGMKAADGLAFKARLIAAQLPAAIARATEKRR